MIITPTFKTKRFILRPLTMKDAKDVHAFASLDEVGPRAGWKPHESLRETKTYIGQCILRLKYNKPGVFALELRDTGKVVGTIEIHAYIEAYKGELGMVLAPKYWGQGLMEEASKILMIYAFEILDLKRLSYRHFTNNFASKRLREKLGFTYEGIKRKGYKRFDGRFLDETVASFTDEDYDAHKASFEAFKESVEVSL